MESALGSYRKQKRPHLVDGWKKAEAHVGEAIVLDAAVHVRTGDVVAEVACDAGRAQGGRRPGRRWTSHTRGQYLLARAIHQVVVTKGTEELRPEISASAWKLGHFALGGIF